MSSHSTVREVQLGSGELAPEPGPTSTASPSAEAHATGPRWDRRTALGAVALVSPLAMAAQYLLSPPGLPRDNADSFLAAIATNPDRYTASVVVYMVSMVTGIAAAAMLAQAGRRITPWLSGIAAALMVVGSIGGGGFAGIRLIAVSMVDQGSVMAGSEQIWTHAQDGYAFNVLGPFVGMAILGLLVGLVALVRMRKAVGWWVAPAYLIGFVLTSGEFPSWVSVIGAAVQIAGLQAVVRQALRD